EGGRGRPGQEHGEADRGDESAGRDVAGRRRSASAAPPAVGLPRSDRAARHLLPASERAALSRWNGADPAGGKRHRSGPSRCRRQKATREVAAETSQDPSAQGRQAQPSGGAYRRRQNRGPQPVENEGKDRQSGRAQGRRPQDGCAQKRSAPEVDETPLNPLITRIQVERSNDTGPCGTGRVSRYRLRTALVRSAGR